MRIYLWLILCLPVFGAEVIRVGSSQRIIAVSHDITRQWKVEDRVCVVQDGREVDCGTVVRAKDKFAIVKLKAGSDLISRGDKVRLDNRVRRPATLMQAEAAPVIQTERNLFHNLSGGFGVGTGFYFPLLHFQRILDPKFALGLMPTYTNISAGSGSLNSISLLVSGNYYMNEYFKGLWCQAAGGLTFLSSTVATIEEQATSLVLLTTVGWRGNWDLGINVGIAGGIQFISNPNFNTINLTGTGVQPLVMVDLGFNF